MVGRIKYGNESFTFSMKEASAGYPETGFTPEAGNQYSTSGFAKMIRRKVATQNEGMECSRNKITDEQLSNAEPCFTAARIPTGKLMRYARITEMNVNSNDQPMCCQIIVSTGIWLTNEIPRSPQINPFEYTPSPKSHR